MKYLKELLLLLCILLLNIFEVKTQDPTTTVTPAPLVNPNVVEYLNDRIRQTLRENPQRNAGELSLASVFNDKLAVLEGAIIREPAERGDDVRAEQALENFRSFVQEYNEVERKLENAIDDLTEIESNTNLPSEKRYSALMMILRLRDSSSLRDAEKALRMYEDFRQRLTNGATPNVTSAPGPRPPAPSPGLTDEYRRYFEEILRILRKHYNIDDPKMQNVLHQLLNNPQQLKKLAAALKELSVEDYDDEDYFWNLFSFW